MFSRKIPVGSKVYAGAAILCGALAFLVFKSEEAKVAALIPRVGAPAPVVEAARGIARGTALSADELKVVMLPSNFAPPGAITDPRAIVGRVAETAIAEGEPVTSTRLAPVRAGPLAALVPPELRAFIVDVSLPPGAVHAGDRVDVLATYAGARPHTETVLTDVEVLQVLSGSGISGGGGILPAAAGGSAVSAPSAGSTGLVLSIDPAESQNLAYATTFGAISVAIQPATSESATAPTPSPVGSP